MNDKGMQWTFGGYAQTGPTTVQRQAHGSALHDFLHRAGSKVQGLLRPSDPFGSGCECFAF